MSTTKVRERPIIFSGESVRQIIAGSKTMTRRVVKPQPAAEDSRPLEIVQPGQRILSSGERVNNVSCPYGKPGDRLWARETWQLASPESCADFRAARARVGAWHPESNDGDGVAFVFYRADGDLVPQREGWETRWRSPIYMPRWASRLLLAVADVRVERLLEISQSDVWMEGIEPRDEYVGESAERFAAAWDALNARRGFPWESNPWVWCLTFRRVEPAA